MDNYTGQRKMVVLSLIKDRSGCRAEYLQLLANIYGDFKVSTCFNKLIWLKHVSVMECWQRCDMSYWKQGKYGKDMWRLDIANQRQILANEIVIDIDQNPKQNLEFCKHLLDRLGWQYEIFSTGSKGFHIHILFDTIVTPKNRGIVIKAMYGDGMKISTGTMIALEFAPHWKTGKMKEIVQENRENTRGYRK